jgi:hypothetical protein
MIILIIIIIIIIIIITDPPASTQVMNQTDQEVIYVKHNTSFVFLRGRAQSPLADHAFIGPTYIEALHREAAGRCHVIMIIKITISSSSSRLARSSFS